MFCHIIVISLTFHFSTSYVLVQGKNDKHLPKPPMAAQTLNATEKVRRFEIKKRADEGNSNEAPRLNSQKTVMMINQAFAALKKITGGPEFRSSKTMSFIDKILDTLKSFVNGPEFRSSKTMRYMENLIDIVREAANGPEYRSNGKGQNMKTEIVHLRSGEPSLIFQLKPKFFLDFVKKVLSTQLLERYMDDMQPPGSRVKKLRPRYT